MRGAGALPGSQAIMIGQGMELLAELIWPPESPRQSRAKVVMDQDGNRFLSLGQEHLFSLAGYENLESDACVKAAPLAGALAALDRSRIEFGAAALVIGQGQAADMWLRALSWRGCAPLQKYTYLSLGAQEKSTASFLDKMERSVFAVESSGDAMAIEILVRLLRRGDVLLLAGAKESEVTLYAYRDVHKKGITLLGVEPSFEYLLGPKEACQVFVRRALNLLAMRNRNIF